MINLDEIISKKPNLIHDRDKLKATLLDSYPAKEDRPQINLLLMIYDLGIINELENVAVIQDYSLFIDQMAQEAANMYFIDKAIATPAVYQWCFAYGTYIKTTLSPLVFRNYFVSAYMGMKADPNDYKSVLLGIMPSEELKKCAAGPILIPDILFSSEESVKYENWKEYHAEIARAIRISIQSGLKGQCDNRYLYLELNAPVINPIFYGTEFSCIELLLSLDYKTIADIVHFNLYTVFTGNEISRKSFKGIVKKDELSKLESENCVLHSETGPEAIRTLLGLVNIEQELMFLELYFGASTGPNEKWRADWQFSAIMGKEFTLVQDKAAFLVRKYELLQYFKEMQISPLCLVTDCIPIPPITDINKTSADLLYLYAALVISNKRLGRLQKLNAPSIIILNEIHLLQNRYEGVIHSRVRNSQMGDLNDQMRHGLLDMITDQMMVRFESDDGTVYWGPIKDSCHLDGTGIIAFHNGNLYVGQFKDDELTGYHCLCVFLAKEERNFPWDSELMDAAKTVFEEFLRSKGFTIPLLVNPIEEKQYAASETGITKADI